MGFYSQQVDANAYYDHITNVTEKCSTGCSTAVSKTLATITNEIIESQENYPQVASKLGICPDSIPSYIQTATTFQEELMMVISIGFANKNMAYYPPDSSTALYQACNNIFQNNDLNVYEKVHTYLLSTIEGSSSSTSRNYQKDNDETEKSSPCFSMASQLPSGPNATISSGDSSLSSVPQRLI